MNTPPVSSLSRHAAPRAGSGARCLAIATLAYVTAVSATVGAAATVVGTGIPLDLLLTLG